MTTSTLATNLTTITNTFSDYLSVVLTNWFPFVIGAIVVVVAIAWVVRKIMQAFF